MAAKRNSLPAKLTPPRIRNRLDRSRLFAILTDAEPAVWICGPPGSGKSTLVASYLSHQGIVPVWIQLDSDDAEPTTFFHLLSMAKEAATRRRIPLPAIEIDTRSDWLRYARNFARALFAGLPAGAALVFDDVEKVGGVMDEILATIIAECPDSQRVILLSHHQPPAPYVDALAKRKMQILLPAMLRFDPVESRQLMSLLGNAQDDPEMDVMVSTAQGWAAGLVLLASQRGTGSTLPSTDAGREQLVEYVSRRVLAWIPANARQIAASCAFFPDFDGSLACAASGDPNARQIIATLHRDGFFIEERGNARENRYAWHGLVAEALRDQAGLPGSQSRRQAETKAARLLVQDNRPEAGISLLLIAEAFAEAASTILLSASDMVARGRNEQLAKWIELLPSEFMRLDPWLAYWRGIATSSYNEQVSLIAFSDAYDRFVQANDQLGMVLAAAGALDAIDVGGQSFRGIEEWATRLTSALSPQPEFPTAIFELRALAGAIFGLSRVGQSPDWFGNWAVRLQDLIVAANNPSLALHAATNRLFLFHDKREYLEAILFANFIERHVDFSQIHVGRVSYWLFSYARLLQAAGETLGQPELLVKAQRCRRDAILMAERYSLTAMQIIIGHTEVAASLNAENFALAKQVLEKIEPLLNSRLVWWLAWQHHGHAKLELALQRPAEALEHMRNVFKYAEQAGAPQYIFRPYHLTIAICLISLQRYDEAIAHLNAGDEQSNSGPDRRFHTVRLFADAMTLMDESTPGALTALRDFVLRMSDAGYLWIFVRPLLARICAKAIRYGVEIELVCGLIAERKLLPPPDANYSWPWPVKIEALGGFRISVYGELLKFDGKAQKKPFDLLKLLIARTASNPSASYGGAGITEVIDELWPELEAKDPKASFDIALHRLRKLLTVDQVITVADGCASLNPALVWCDAIHFSRACEANLKSVKVKFNTWDELSFNEYRGSLFGDKEVADWAFSARERLANLFIKLVSLRGAALEEARHFAEAIKVYERGIEQDNLVDPFYRGLMRCHLALGEPAEAIRAYRRCREILSVVLGVEPSEETRELRATMT